MVTVSSYKFLFIFYIGAIFIFLLDDQEEIVPVDIAEGCIGALHVLARDPINRTAIKESNVISTICSFLSLQSVNPSLTNENMQRSAGTFFDV